MEDGRGLRGGWRGIVVKEIKEERSIKYLRENEVKTRWMHCVKWKGEMRRRRK